MKTVKELTSEEKLRLLCGRGNWHTEDFEGSLERVRMTDASMGIRMPLDPNEWQDDRPSIAYPSRQTSAVRGPSNSGVNQNNSI